MASHDQIQRDIYLLLFQAICQSPKSRRALKQEIRSSTIRDVNKKVSPIIERGLEPRGRSKEAYIKLTPEQKASIGRRAAEHGVIATICYVYIRSTSGHPKVTFRLPSGPHQVTFRSPPSHHQVAVRSPTGNRQVTERSPLGNHQVTVLHPQVILMSLLGHLQVTLRAQPCEIMMA